MKTTFLFSFCMSMLAASATSLAQDKNDEEGEHEEIVAFTSAPSAVQATFKRIIGLNVPKQIEREQENGKTTWEASYKTDGLNHELKVNEKGDVLELEKEIPAATLPQTVRNAIMQKYPAATIKKGEEIHLNGGVPIAFFEVVLAGAGKVSEVKVRPNGDFVK